MPADLAGYYRSAYRTMKGRADLYVAFFEAALHQLTEGGVCAFICADRWMLNHYGGELRRLVTSKFAVEAVVEMHEADAFATEVSAYPAVTVIRRAPQRAAVVASVGRDVVEDGRALAKGPYLTAGGEAVRLPAGVLAARVNSWFAGNGPWPCTSPGRLALLKKLEERFSPLESKETGTKVGIGVAIGAGCQLKGNERLSGSNQFILRIVMLAESDNQPSVTNEVLTLLHAYRLLERFGRQRRTDLRGNIP